MICLYFSVLKYSLFWLIYMDVSQYSNELIISLHSAHWCLLSRTIKKFLWILLNLLFIFSTSTQCTGSPHQLPKWIGVGFRLHPLGLLSAFKNLVKLLDTTCLFLIFVGNIMLHCIEKSALNKLANLSNIERRFRYFSLFAKENRTWKHFNLFESRGKNSSQ